MKRKATPVVLLETGSESSSSPKLEGAGISSGSDWDANAESEGAFDEEAEESEAEESEGGGDEILKKPPGRKGRRNVQAQERDANVSLRRGTELVGRTSGAGKEDVAKQAEKSRAGKRKREQGSGEEDDSDEEDLATRRRKLRSRKVAKSHTGGETEVEGRMRLRPRGGRGKVGDGGVEYSKRGGREPISVGSGTEEDDRDLKPAGKKRVVVKPPDKFLEEKWTMKEVEEAECESSGTLDSFIADDDEVEEGNEGLTMPALLSSEDGESSESSGAEGGAGIPEADTDNGDKNAHQRGGAKVDLSDGRQAESTKIDNRGSMKRRRRSVVDDDPEEEERDDSRHLMNRNRTGKDAEEEEVVPARKQGRLRREGSEVKAVRAAVGRRGCVVEPMSMAERVEEHRKRVMHGESGEEEEEEEDCDAAGRSNSEEGLEDELGEEEEDAFVVPDAEGRTHGYGNGGSDEERDGEEGEEEDEGHPAGLRASRDDFRVYLVYVMKCILLPGFDQLARASKDAKQCFDKVVRKAEEDVVVVRSSVVSSKAWQPRVKVALQRRPLLTMTLLNTTHIDGDCDACKRAEHAAPHVVTLEGPPYDPNEIWEVQRTEEEMQAVIKYRKSVTARQHTLRGSMEEEPETFHMGRHCFSRCQMYHVLHHYKPRLIARLRHELTRVQRVGHKRDLIEHVLSGGQIVRGLYQNYKKMVLLANRFLLEETTRFGRGQEGIIQGCQQLVEEIQHVS